jgi:hypothetical protein
LEGGVSGVGPIDFEGTEIEYGELEDAFGWIIEAPFRVGDTSDSPAGDDILSAAAKALDVHLDDLVQFKTLGLSRVASGDYGLSKKTLDSLLGEHERELTILIGIAAARGKCPGP